MPMSFRTKDQGWSFAPIRNKGYEIWDFFCDNEEISWDFSEKWLQSVGWNEIKI